MMNVRLVLGLVILATFAVVGFILPGFAPEDPTAWQAIGRNRRPGLEHLLGTTSQGQDVFWLATWSVRNSLLLGITVGVAATVIGVLIGLAAGYIGGLFDRVVSFFTDSMIAIPLLPVLILVAAIMRGQLSLAVVAVVLVAFNWPFPARQVRSVALSLRERGFVHTAWMSGESRLRVIVWQFAPYLTSWALANLINTVLVALIFETSIAVIGLSSAGQTTLGTMLYWSLTFQAILAGRWWWYGTPVLAMVILFVGLFLTSSGLSQRSAAIRGRLVAQ